MDMLTTIESEIVNVLNTIDGLETPDGYTFHSTTGTVNIYDEMVSVDTNIGIDPSLSVVNYEIEQDTTGEDNLEFSLGANGQTNEVVYVIKAKIHNTGAEINPKRESQIKMNEALGDIKYAFGNNFALNKKCNWFIYAGSTRTYAENNDMIQTGTLNMRFKLNYSQALFNPEVHACL